MIACRHDATEISFSGLLEEYYALRANELGAFLNEKNAVICGASILYAHKPWEVELDAYESDLNIIYQTIPTDADNAFDWKLHMIGIQEYTVSLHKDTIPAPSVKNNITFQKVTPTGRTVKITVIELYCTWKEFLENADLSIHQNYTIYEEAQKQFVMYTYHPNLLKYRLFKKMYESDVDSQNERIAKYVHYGYHYFVEIFSGEEEQDGNVGES
jgi:hypothetical protein